MLTKHLDWASTIDTFKSLTVMFDRRETHVRVMCKTTFQTGYRRVYILWFQFKQKIDFKLSFAVVITKLFGSFTLTSISDCSFSWTKSSWELVSWMVCWCCYFCWGFWSESKVKWMFLTFLTCSLASVWPPEESTRIHWGGPEQNISVLTQEDVSERPVTDVDLCRDTGSCAAACHHVAFS